MNKIVASWNKQEARKRYNGPDSIKVDGQKLQIGEIDSMASRKKPVTEPVLDNDAVNKDKNAEKSLIVHELSKHDFDSLLWYISRSSHDRVMILRGATFNTLKRLGIKRNKKKAIKSVPKKANGQGDAGSIVVWLSKIQPTHKKSITQLIKIDATICVRTD